MRTQILLPALLMFAAACGKPSPAPDDKAEPSSSTNAATATGNAGAGNAAGKAVEIFTTRCTPCHGPSGAGDGPASASLQPKPRNFNDAAWQSSIDDAYIEKIIKFGGAAVGKSPAMPGNPDLNDPQVVAELRSVVRGFKP